MKNITLLNLLFAMGCHEDALLEPEVPEFSIVQGDTARTEVTKGFSEFKKLDFYSKDYAIVGDSTIIFTPQKLPSVKNNVEISALRNTINKTNTFRYVSIGSTVASGYRDGGYFNEGIITSYPNLLARQMGIDNFRQPLFSARYYNGFGRKVVSSYNPTGGPVTKFKEANNNLAVFDSQTFSLEPFEGDLDNYAVPMAGRMILFNEGYVPYDIKQPSSAKASLDRILGESRNFSSIFNKISKDAKIDIATIDFNTAEIHDALFATIPKGESFDHFYTSSQKVIDQKPEEYGTGGGLFPLYVSPALQIARNMEKMGVKAVLLNVPDENITLNRTYVSTSYFEDLFGIDHYIYIKDRVTRIYDSYSFVPNTEVDSLLGKYVNLHLKRGISFERPLTNNFLLGKPLSYQFPESVFSNQYNLEIQFISKRFGYPVVDINSLYNNIFHLKYQSWDGVSITPELFYSSDGMFPSALGNAVITNEIIKVINTHYKTKIELISIKDFLNR